MKETQDKAPKIPKGWDKADSCTDDLIKIGRKLFGASTIASWAATLKRHIASGANYTGYEEYLTVNRRELSVDGKADLLLREIIARCASTVVEMEDTETDEDGAERRTWNEKSLKGFTFHNPELVFRPNGYAKVIYMGTETEPEVLGMIGINCLIYCDGRPYVKPTVLFVSKPFHQYRAVAIHK